MSNIIGQRVMRCSDGHLFTASERSRIFRSAHLGPRRLMRCPVDGRWRLMQAVDAAGLSEAQREEAKRHQA